MREIRGNLWDYHRDGHWVCVTTNGIVRSDGAAVMGRGVALQAKQQFPGLEYDIGQRISRIGNHVHALKQYRMFTFPVKYHWRDRADLGLIKMSCYELMKRVQRRDFPSHVILPRPGCGNGGLDWHNVRDAIYEILPDNVWVITNVG